ncbi:hypothetical protein G7Y89_g684 [Cudoniella acicularis]|uniref:Uncharacterized protein n=1 Tax=Cudoniella acicularis TaxID=354080 RepID=A0A8H4RYC3_9HELO|nr:hypothetical protein G7Y89_g684 [Cudoniella acicularis]
MGLNFLRDDYKLTTWISLGAFLQSLLFLLYPRRIVALPAIFFIALLAFKGLLLHYGPLPNRIHSKVRLGRMTAQVVDEDSSVSKGSSKGVVIFLLGARSNDTMRGIFTPGYKESGDLFGAMWRDLSANREKWGYLGKTSTLIATDDENSNSMAWISYWRSLEHLQAFAHGEMHKKGRNWYLKGKYRNFGIMHETYVVPAGNWETIYLNFTPFGLGQTKQPVKVGEKQIKDDGNVAYASGLREAKGPTWQSMKSRMKRVAAGEDSYSGHDD